MQFLSSFQRFLMQHKVFITRVLLFLAWMMPILWMYGAYVYVNQREEYVELYKLGRYFGQLAFILYCLTLVPGILRRFQILPIVQAMIMPFRRNIGVLMFLTAIVHMGFVSTIPIFFKQPYVAPILTQHQTFGFVGLLLLFPLWLTSNNFSQRKLGRKWTTVHKLTHIAVFFLFAHVALVNDNMKILGGIVLTANILSWLKFWFTPKVIPTNPPSFQG